MTVNAPGDVHGRALYRPRSRIQASAVERDNGGQKGPEHHSDNGTDCRYGVRRDASQHRRNRRQKCMKEYSSVGLGCMECCRQVIIRLLHGHVAITLPVENIVRRKLSRVH
jgi:hypothetical protein